MQIAVLNSYITTNIWRKFDKKISPFGGLSKITSYLAVKVPLKRMAKEKFDRIIEL